MSLTLRRLFLVFGAPKVAYPACGEGTEHAALKVYVPHLRVSSSLELRVCSSSSPSAASVAITALRGRGGPY